MLRTIFPRRLYQWLGPLLAAGLLALIVAAIVVVSGVFNLAATTPHPQTWAKFLHYTFRRSVAFHSSELTPPKDLDSPTRIAMGAGHYANVCANCHGAPGIGQNPIALAMTPRPPYLAAQITGDNAREIFWILKHGVKYSAMPGWPTQVRDDEIWSMVAFARALPKLNYDQYRQLAFGEAATPTGNSAPQTPFGPAPALRRYVSFNSNIPQGNINWYVTPAAGPDSFAQDDTPLNSCVRCHGAAGTGRVVGAFPNIAIQTPGYLQQTLAAFASGRRYSAIMQTVAAQLSPAQIEALSAHYAAQPIARSLAATVEPLPANYVAMGEQIAERGLRERGIGACSGCHALVSNDARVYPRLRGQNADYMIQQMRLFRAGGRGNSLNYNPMVKVAAKLSDQEIVAVSAYYAEQTPTAALVAPADRKLIEAN